MFLSQQAAWRKTREVFDEAERRYSSLSLFPEDRELPPDAVDSVPVKLKEMQLRRPRAFGHCWLGCELWRQLGRDRFWQARLPRGRESVPWPQVLELLVVNRLIDPGSEFRLQVHAPGLTPRAVLDKLATIEMIDVWFPTTDGRWLVMPRRASNKRRLRRR